MRDVIVIGAGHNGLVAALRLGRAGRRVLVLEGSGQPGGLCAAREFHPGYSVPGVHHDSSTFRPAIARALALPEQGLVFCRDETPLLVPCDEDGLLLDPDPQAAGREIGRRSAKDEAAWLRLHEFLERVRPVLRALLEQRPAPLSPSGPADWWQLCRQGLALRRLGSTDMLELLRVLPMCVADWLGEQFENQALSEALAFHGVNGSVVGPWAAGSAANLLFHAAGSGVSIQGGPAALIRALVAGCRQSGVEIRTAAAVSRIRIRDGRVRGVRLESGEEIDAPVVAASCDPRKTMLELVHPSQLAAGEEKQFQVFRARGVAAKLHLALEAAPRFRGREEAGFEAARIGGGHLDELERAFDAVKYGRFSEAPHLDVRVPTLSDPALAPPGHHVLSILAHCAPLQLEGGWTNEARSRFTEAVIARLEAFSPGVRERIVGLELLTPADIEQQYAATGGHLFHGEHALDQLLAMRPARCAGRYRTPIEGLFLAGSGSHPGGGVTGLPGFLAAEAILKLKY